MASDEKRVVSGYEIIHAIYLGDKEVIVGDSPMAPADERYMCAYCQYTGPFEQYIEAVVSDDYAEIMQEFGERVAKQAEKTRIDLNKPKILGIDNAPIGRAACAPISEGNDLRNKIVVIKAENLRREYQTATNQIMLCIGGSGASPFSRGTSCLCVNLYSGESSYFKRWDVLGTLDEAKLPKWAEHGLMEYRQKQRGQEAKRKEEQER